MGLFRLTGTATRGQTLRVVLLTLVACLAYALLRSQGAPMLATNLLAGTAALLFAAALAAVVRRLHDAGRSGLWVLTVLAPGLGLLAIIVILLLPPAPQKFKATRVWPRVLGVLGLVLLCLLAVGRAIWQPVWGPSTSMQPTLMPGDVMAVLPARVGNLQRGDLVIHHDPARGADRIGRLVGLPGDTVQMVDGRLVLNGQDVPQTPAGDFVQPKVQQGPAGAIPRCGNDPVAEGADCITARMTETLPNGRAYYVLNLIDGWLGDNTAPVTLPQDQFFLLGDNRDNAHDSRYDQTLGGAGLVAGANLVGRIDRVLFSAPGASLLSFWTWRSDRFMLRPL